MLACDDLVANLDDQVELLVLEAAALVVGDGGTLLEDRIGADHLTRHQVLADAEMLQRALGLGAPQLVGLDLDCTKAVGFGSHLHAHVILLVGEGPHIAAVNITLI